MLIKYLNKFKSFKLEIIIFLNVILNKVGLNLSTECWMQNLGSFTCEAFVFLQWLLYIVNER